MTTRARLVTVLLGLACLLVAGCPRPPAPGTLKSTRPGNQPDDAFEQARDALSRRSDIESCRTALDQVNLHINRHPERKPSPLTDAQRQLLEKPDGLNLHADGLKEVEADRFTKLDGEHLDQCFLFRDVAQTLALEGKPQPEQVLTAFQWTMRQVRLGEPEEPAPAKPPHWVLRRGWGSSIERSLIFACLLEQLGIPACLLGPTTDKQSLTTAWGVGALVTSPEGSEVLVFDARLGLPLPGPGGKGVVTLSQLRKQPDLVAPLTVDEKTRYDLTPELIRDVRIYPVTWLSALSPRMRMLQDDLTVAEVKGTLAEDGAKLIEAWKAAAGGVEVRFGLAGTRVLYEFFPPDEGGIDRSQQKQLFAVTIIPWLALPPQLAAVKGDAGKRLQMQFAYPFIEMALGAGKPRDLMLRGKFRDVDNNLVELRTAIDEVKGQVRTVTDLDKQVADWRKAMINAEAAVLEAQAEVQRSGGRDAQNAVSEAKAKVDAVWREGLGSERGAGVIALLLIGRSADIRAAEVRYLLALSKHEQAERSQAQMESRRKAGKTPTTDEEKSVREDWENAARWWEEYTSEHRTLPAAPSARLWAARARQMMGENATAIALLEDLSGDLTLHEKVARLYLARQLKK